jgi:hypothetical protein
VHVPWETGTCAPAEIETDIKSMRTDRRGQYLLAITRQLHKLQQLGIVSFVHISYVP